MDLPLWTRDDVIDVPTHWPVSASRELANAHVFSVVSERLRTPAGEEIERTFLHHPGAVIVIPLDAEENVVVLRQYRHPVGARMIEAPAGLLDVAGEDPLVAAQRELAEEAMLAADDWRVLVDYTGSAGSSGESVRIFLARGLRPAARPDGFVVEGEEAEMTVGRVALDDLVDAALAGRIANGALVAGVLAVAAAQARGGLETLRPAEAPWLLRGHQAGSDAQRG